MPITAFYKIATTNVDTKKYYIPNVFLLRSHTQYKLPITKQAQD